MEKKISQHGPTHGRSALSHSRLDQHTTPCLTRKRYHAPAPLEAMTAADTSNTLHKPPGQKHASLNGDALIIIDEQGRIEYMNPLAAKLSGWSLQDAHGQPLGEVFDLAIEEGTETVLEHTIQCLKNGHVTAGMNATLWHCQTGQALAIQVSITPIFARSGDVSGAAIAFKDVSRQRRLVQKMHHHATHDALTGLVNRREFERRLQHALKGQKEHGGHYVLCYLDLDRFKQVNDTAGHAAGDLLLKQIADRFLGQLRDRDTLARLGGDEFALLLDNCRLDYAEQIIQKLIYSVCEFDFAAEGRTFRIGACAGLVEINANEAERAEQLLEMADSACYRAKHQGGNQVAVYRSDDTRTFQHHLVAHCIENLKDALEHNRLRLGLQPIVSLNGDDTTPLYQEFLLRLRNSGEEVLLPSAFLPTAERCNLMSAIDRWVIHTAFLGIATKTGPTKDSCFAINISKQSLSDDSMPEFIKEQLSLHTLAPERICFEISEEAAVHDLRRTAGFIAALKGIGCRFALDGFGSGALPVKYLKKLPVDYLKIHGAYVLKMAADPFAFAMVEAINIFGHRLGIQTIAEHVETNDTLQMLKELNVDYAQGFGIAAPTIKGTHSAGQVLSLAG